MSSPRPIELRSDNAAGAAPEILDAVVAANLGSALAYGADDWTAHLREVDAAVDCVETRHLANDGLGESGGASRELHASGAHEYPASKSTRLRRSSPALKRRRFSMNSARVRSRTCGDEFEECGLIMTFSSVQSA